MKKVMAVAVALSALAGCTIPTTAQRQAGGTRQILQAAASELRACEANLRASPAAQPLLPHLPQVGAMPDLNMLMDPQTISPQEAIALRAVYPQYQQCHQVAISEISPVVPEAAAIMGEIDAKREAETIKLLQGTETWGSYWSQIKTIVADGQQQLAQVASGMASNLERSHEAELQRRQNAAAISAAQMNAAAAMFQAGRPQVMPGPTFTNCQHIGSTLNCTTMP